MPLGEIAEYIRKNSAPRGAVILVDSANSDPVGLEYALGPDVPLLRTQDPATEKALTGRHGKPVWFLRNTHDVSEGGLNARYEAELRKTMQPTTFYYQPYSLLERGLLHAMGVQPTPWYFQELLEFK